MAQITDLKVQEFSYTWKIKNFRYLRLYDGTLTSPPYTCGDNGELCFNLKLSNPSYPNKLSDYVTVYPFFTKCDSKALIEISLLNSDDKSAVSLTLLASEFRNQSTTYEKFVKKDFIFDKANNLLPYDTLTVICKIFIEKGVKTYSSEIEKFLKNIQPNKNLKLSENFEQLLVNNKYSDLKLIVDGKEFLVNKCILASRSRVFAAMLEHKMKESSENKIEIHDVEPEVMQEMLRFIYAGKVKDIKRLASGLLVAADKYELDDLKKQCQEILIGGLNLENVDEVLILLDRYKAEELRTATMNFITENARALYDSDKFRKALKSLSQSLLTDIMSGFMIKF